MPTSFHRWRMAARHATEFVPAALLAAMFLAFILQVFMRYVINDPVGWTVEICVIAWVWVILWGQSLSASEDDEIRFDILYSNMRGPLRRVFRLIFSAFLVVIYAIALPATWSYVTFMSIEETSYLDIPYSWVFSVFVLFLVVSILRYGRIFVGALRGAETGTADDDPHAVSRRDLSQ